MGTNEVCVGVVVVVVVFVIVVVVVAVVIVAEKFVCNRTRGEQEEEENRRTRRRHLSKIQQPRLQERGIESFMTVKSNVCHSKNQKMYYYMKIVP